MRDNLTVHGFYFESSGEYVEAKREAEAIEYISLKMDINNPQIAMKVYYKLLERQNLHTIVGLTFLKELHDRIVSAGLIEEKNIKSIMIKANTGGKTITEYGDEEALVTDTHNHNNADEIEEDEGVREAIQKVQTTEKEQNLKFSREREKKLKTVADYYHTKVKKCYIIITALALIIAAMFGISIYNGSFSSNNAEIELQNKYAAWEEELQNRENELKERESRLD